MCTIVIALYLSLQDENTPFCPSCIKSNFLHVLVVVQVEHPNSTDTVYKVRLEVDCMVLLTVVRSQYDNALLDIYSVRVSGWCDLLDIFIPRFCVFRCQESGKNCICSVVH